MGRRTKKRWEADGRQPLLLVMLSNGIEQPLLEDPAPSALVRAL